MTRQLTGRHVLAIAIAAFGTIIAVNVGMLLAATGSFPGLVVKNSYVASQGWDARSQAQQALGWTATAGWQDGRLVVDLRGADGAPVPGLALEALVGRPTLAAEDRTVALIFGERAYAASAALAPGAWRIELRTTDGPAFSVVQQIFVPEVR